MNSFAVYLPLQMSVYESSSWRRVVGHAPLTLSLSAHVAPGASDIVAGHFWVFGSQVAPGASASLAVAGALASVAFGSSGRVAGHLPPLAIAGSHAAAPGF